MKVRCIRSYPTEAQVKALGTFYENQSFPLTPGETYTVYAMEFVVGSLAYGTSALFHVPVNDRLCVAPALLFEIVDARVPPVWQVAKYEDESVLLAPSTMLTNDHFHEDLVYGDARVRNEFRSALREMEELE